MSRFYTPTATPTVDYGRRLPIDVMIQGLAGAQQSYDINKSIFDAARDKYLNMDYISASGFDDADTYNRLQQEYEEMANSALQAYGNDYSLMGPELDKIKSKISKDFSKQGDAYGLMSRYAGYAQASKDWEEGIKTGKYKESDWQTAFLPQMSRKFRREDGKGYNPISVSMIGRPDYNKAIMDFIKEFPEYNWFIEKQHNGLIEVTEMEQKAFMDDLENYLSTIPGHNEWKQRDIEYMKSNATPEELLGIASAKKKETISALEDKRLAYEAQLAAAKKAGKNPQEFQDLIDATEEGINRLWDDSNPSYIPDDAYVDHLLSKEYDQAITAPFAGFEYVKEKSRSHIQDPQWKFWADMQLEKERHKNNKALEDYKKYLNAGIAWVEPGKAISENITLSKINEDTELRRTAMQQHADNFNLSKKQVMKSMGMQTEIINPGKASDDPQYAAKQKEKVRNSWNSFDTMFENYQRYLDTGKEAYIKGWTPQQLSGMKSNYENIYLQREEYANRKIELQNFLVANNNFKQAMLANPKIASELKEQYQEYLKNNSKEGKGIGTAGSVITETGKGVLQTALAYTGAAVFPPLMIVPTLVKGKAAYEVANAATKGKSDNTGKKVMSEDEFMDVVFGVKTAQEMHEQGYKMWGMKDYNDSGWTDNIFRKETLSNAIDEVRNEELAFTSNIITMNGGLFTEKLTKGINESLNNKGHLTGYTTAEGIDAQQELESKLPKGATNLKFEALPIVGGLSDWSNGFSVKVTYEVPGDGSKKEIGSTTVDVKADPIQQNAFEEFYQIMYKETANLPFSQAQKQKQIAAENYAKNRFRGQLTDAIIAYDSGNEFTLHDSAEGIIYKMSPEGFRNGKVAYGLTMLLPDSSSPTGFQEVQPNDQYQFEVRGKNTKGIEDSIPGLLQYIGSGLIERDLSK